MSRVLGQHKRLKRVELSRPAGVPSREGARMIAQGPESVSTALGLDAFVGIDQRVLDAIPSGFCVCRTDSGLVRYNRRAVELWGRAPPLDDPRQQRGGTFRRYSADGERLDFEATPVAAAMRSG